jgi:hypothetical protein
MFRRFQRLLRSKFPSENPSSLARVDSFRVSALIFAVLLACGLFLVLPAIRAPFFWDDLHLIRVHTPQELAQVWTGTWDSDHIETPGFRPLTAWFNHLRALAFGESVAAHRAFLLVLFALYLTMAGLLARQLFAASFWQMVLGGLLILFHISSVYHYFWIADGVHLLGGILIIGCLVSFLKALSSGRWPWLFASLSCAALALLTREDALAVYPLLLWFGGAHLFWKRRAPGTSALPKWFLAGFGVTMAIACGAYWYARAIAIPNAAPSDVNPRALLWALAQTIQNAGDQQLLAVDWPRYHWMIWLWIAWLGALVVSTIVALKRRAQLIALFWAGAMLIAAAPLLVVARLNLVLLPVTFWGLLVAHVLAQFWRQWSAVGWRVFASAMILFAVAAPAYGSFLFEREMRPNNLVLMCRNASLLYGLSGPAIIPPARRASVQDQLTTYGITSLADFEASWPSMERRALADGRLGVNAAGLPFIPMFEFLPQFGLHPRCEPPK